MTREKLDIATYGAAPPPPPIVVGDSLQNTSWEMIKRVADTGRAYDFFNVGDQKTIVLTTGEELTFEIWGFNHDDTADGGKAGITFGMRELMATQREMNPTATNAGGWRDSQMRNVFIQEIWNTIPQEIREVIKPVNKQSSTGLQQAALATTEDNIFLFSPYEIATNPVINVNTTRDGEQYEYWRSFRDGNIQANRVKRLGNGAGHAPAWRTRTACITPLNTWATIMSDGLFTQHGALSIIGVCFGFCV